MLAGTQPILKQGGHSLVSPWVASIAWSEEMKEAGEERSEVGSRRYDVPAFAAQENSSALLSSLWAPLVAAKISPTASKPCSVHSFFSIRWDLQREK